MAKNYVYRIVDDKDVLSMRSVEVNPDEPIKNIKSIIRDIKSTLKANNDVYSLCAAQLGTSKRIFCIKFKDKVMTFVNPMITHTNGQHLSREKNASLTSEYIVPRADSIVAMYQDDHGKICENKFDGMASELFEQMCQMLDGILLSDYGLEVLAGFDDLSDDDKAEIFKSYSEYLNQLGVKLDENIEKDKTMHDMKKAIEYMSSVAKGETEVVPEYNGELDFSKSTKVRIEKENQIEKENKERLQKKIDELKNAGRL